MNSFGSTTQSNANDGGASFENISELRNIASRKLMESGEHDRLVKHLRSRLTECGWRDELVMHCKKVVRDKGVDNVTMDDLVREVQPDARRKVPDAVKQELVTLIRNFLTSTLDSELK